MTNETQEIKRSYIDNYAIKEFVSNTLIPKYFPDIDVSLRTVGMVGMTTELISNIAEDSFNATSVLFREAFPNRAEIPESIYSHAAIFQLSNIFSQASACSFLIVLEEDSIINNMKYNAINKMYYFNLDKNTTVYIENVPYVLDYDIGIRCIKKTTSNSEQYVFTASYILDDYNNSISNITDPYIKIRRSNNGFIALEVKMHQVTRDIHYEPIITNSKINMPSIDITFDGQLVGFDVLYKTAEESDYTKQLQKLLVYSQPIASPFCYYQLYNDNVLRLSFNARDSYFIPEFNSELKVILYLSKGKEANFDAYTGNNITVTLDTETYNYNSDIVIAAKPLTGSVGGADRLGIDELQQLTIEGYRTALALTTEPDLSTFFSNYKYNYGNFAINFIKRRNDVYERIFGGYCVMQYESEIFKTNTLDIHMNLSDMTNPENNIYMIEPGTLFTYDNTKDNHVSFYRDPDQYKENHTLYLDAINKNDDDIKYTNDEYAPEYIKSRNVSFAEYKRRNGINDTLHVFDLTEEKLSELASLTNSFIFVNPFLIRFKKSPNLVSLYQTYINEKSTMDFTNQNNDTFVQFVSYQVQVERYFEKNKEYKITTSVMPSITLDAEYPIIKRLGINEDTKESIYNLNNKYTLDQNDLRVLFVIYDNNSPICYSEMYPISFKNDTNLIYETRFNTDDHITSDNKLRLLDGTIYLVKEAENIKEKYTNISNIENDWYFKETSDDGTSYSLYDTNNELQKENIAINDITNMIKNGYVKKYSNLTRMSNVSGNILIPMENVVCKVFTLYRRKYQESNNAAAMVETTPDDTNNIFAQYDETYDTYVWTNEYTTGLEPLTFIKPLNHVRSNLYFEDYTLTNPDDSFVHDIMDVRMESLPFIKWDLAYDSFAMSTFMSIFNAQYENITSIIMEKLRNETSIDFKFYNTYGRSTNYFIIGDTDGVLNTLNLNTLNLKIAFDMWFIAGTDTLAVVPEIKQFIKEKIETISDNGTNQIHISNLMRDIEQNYSYIDHIRFRGINDYDTTYQSIILKHDDIDELTRDERRKYVPELLVIDLDDIIINEYTM